jgi:hypothetical protein
MLSPQPAIYQFNVVFLQVIHRFMEKKKISDT